MNNVLEKIKSDIRIVLSVLLFVFMALTWFHFTASEEEYGMSVGADFSGFTVLSESFLAMLLFIFPIIFVVIYFIPALGKFKKAVYPIGALGGVVLTLLCGFIIKGLLSAGADLYAGMGVEASYKFGIGLWLTVLDYVGILVYSLIVDFKVSKDSFKEQGIKGLVSSVASDVASSATSMAQGIRSGDVMRDIQSNVKNGEIVKGMQSEARENVPGAQPAAVGIPCPQCGNIITAGKKFCKGCGYKLPQETAAAPVQENAAANGTAKPQVANVAADRGRKAAAVAGQVHGIVCETCGLVSDYTKEYCADCGAKLKNVKICASCGAEIIEGKTFCADCGTPISTKNICKKCGAEIWGRKAFCACCGEKVNYTKTCSNCGAEIIAGKNFCPDCGKAYVEHEDRT